MPMWTNVAIAMILGAGITLGGGTAAGVLSAKSTANSPVSATSADIARAGDRTRLPHADDRISAASNLPTSRGFFAADKTDDRRAVPQSSGFLVVVDPGHGGSNFGAASRIDGIFEKHLTLAIAHELKVELETRGHRVELTREHDTYLSLRQRMDFANRQKADLFVSIHANATERHNRRGFETFLLSESAVSIDSPALRRAPTKHLATQIVNDLDLAASQPAAARAAQAIQRELARVRGANHDRGVKQGSMHVLLGATMPAVLVEVGFIDHPAEGPELLRKAGRKQITAALADAIDSIAQAER